MARTKSQWTTQGTSFGGSLCIPGFTLLVAAQLLDICTTIVGLWLIPALVEKNPIAQFMIEDVGLTVGLVILGFLIVLVAAGMIELAAIELVRHTGTTVLPAFIRLVGYGSISLIYIAAAMNNAVLIANQVSLDYLVTGLPL